MDKNISKDLKNVIKDQGEKIYIYFRSSKQVIDSYDPFRNTGKLLTRQNPIFIKGIVREINADKLIIKELGIHNLGAVEILVKDQDAQKLKLAEKITINNIEYTTKNKALGDRFVSFKQRGFGITKCIAFQKENN